MSEKRIKLTGIQRKIAQKMSESRRIIPHVTTIREARMDKVTELREKVRKELENKVEKLSFMPFIIKAAADAMAAFPLINSSYDESQGEIIV